MTKDSTLSFFNRTDQAQRRSKRHCQRSLSSRGASLQQLLWRSQRLHQKGGVIASEIMLPPHAPEIYLDRATLWNAVENCEKHPKAQLAYSFDIAMQNELTLEENMELARKFVQEQFVTKGMIADLAFHSPEKEDGGIPNPHFHVMTTMRPLNPDGTWGQKQRREYLLDEDGNRIRDKNGDYMFNAVHTTDWHEPETLEHWREQWAAAVNTKFEEKGLDVRIDHRSYVRQGLDLIPTVHEGANVRQMEAKGIRTEKGELNRWIKATNRLMQDVRKKIKALFVWMAEVKEELSKPQTPSLADLLIAYYNQRNAGAWSNKARTGNLKQFAGSRQLSDGKQAAHIRGFAGASFLCQRRI